jgi:hypothetical protein
MLGKAVIRHYTNKHNISVLVELNKYVHIKCIR